MRWRSFCNVLLAAHIGTLPGTPAFAQATGAGAPDSGDTGSEYATAGSTGAPVAPGSLDAAGDFGSPSLDYRDGDEPVLVSPDTTSYQFYITDLENRHGPYAPGLSEQLLGLGMAYRKQGLYAQAAEVFKRGVHVARINEGLYSESQIPLLQGLIESLVAAGDYEAADERQYYLYRVQAEVYGRQSREMSLAMLERAEWERQAYYLSLGDTSFMRLLRMWELYSGALRNVARNEGTLSPQLLQPLEGLLETQYMISTYTPEAQTGVNTGNAPDSNYAEESRFSMIRVSNYKQGQAVLTAMRDVYGYNEEARSPKPAEALVQMGDWHLWHQKRDSAMEAYQKAWAELGALQDGENLQRRYFGQPTLLPDIPDMNPEPPPPAVVTGHVVVSFSVDPRGRIKNLEVLSNEPVDETMEADDGDTVQLLRSLKRMQYRPRLVLGEAVQTDNLQKRYAY
jgi:hypothetical protein